MKPPNNIGHGRGGGGVRTSFFHGRGGCCDPVLQCKTPGCHVTWGTALRIPFSESSLRVPASSIRPKDNPEGKAKSYMAK